MDIKRRNGFSSSSPAYYVDIGIALITLIIITYYIQYLLSLDIVIHIPRSTVSMSVSQRLGSGKLTLLLHSRPRGELFAPLPPFRSPSSADGDGGMWTGGK